MNPDKYLILIIVLFLMNQRKDKLRSKSLKASLQELPYFNYRGDLTVCHGQFNNSYSPSCQTKKSLDKLSSLYDIDLFSLNTRQDEHLNSNNNLLNQRMYSRYFSPHNFQEMKNKLTKDEIDCSFSIFHNNILSINRNLENLQTHLLDELNFHFNIIGVTETKITNSNPIVCCPTIPGYEFEYVPTPLASGGVGMFIDETLNYKVLERTSNEAFQALWIEISFVKKKNVICGVIYRQHNSPESFQSYFEETIEKLTSTGKQLYILGDFNIDLLKFETCRYSHDFLVSLQSCYLIPTIDKPTRVRNTSATLIDNIFVNNPEQVKFSGNLISDISDHFSQFCIMKSVREKPTKVQKTKFRDYSRFSADRFNDDLSQLDWNNILSNANNDMDKLFSSFYNKFNKIVNKHAPMKTLSHRKAKQFSKPWITKGIRTSIE